MSQQWNPLIALAAGGALYYLAEPKLGIALLAVGLLTAVGYFDSRLDRISKQIEAVSEKLRNP